MFLCRGVFVGRVCVLIVFRVLCLGWWVLFLLFLVVLLLFLVVGRGVVFVVWRGCVDLRCSELFRDFDNLGVSLAQLRPPFVWDAGARELGCGGEHENARVHGRQTLGFDVDDYDGQLLAQQPLSEERNCASPPLRHPVGHT